ncbi:MAG: hypothetical protein ACM3O7_10435, partial [Acidobacteriota bacterium]
LYGRQTRQRNALDRVERRALPEGWAQLGPVGVLHIEKQMLSEALGALGERVGGPPPRASVVVPDAWVRPLLLDFETIPRRREEAEEVVRWRLKRLLPCRPEDVRLDYTPSSDNGHLLVLVALERPLAALEEAFAAAGVQVGRIEPLTLALANFLPPAPLPILLAVVDGRSLGLTVVTGGRPVLMRQKLLPLAPAATQTYVFRELSRTVSHLRAGAGPSGILEVWLAGVDDPVADAAAEWAVGQEAVAVRRLRVDSPGLPEGGHGIDSEDVRVWSLLGTAWVGEPR